MYLVYLLAIILGIHSDPPLCLSLIDACRQRHDHRPGPEGQLYPGFEDRGVQLVRVT